MCRGPERCSGPTFGQQADRRDMFGEDDWRLGLEQIASRTRVAGDSVLVVRRRPTRLLPRRSTLADFECARPSAGLAEDTPRRDGTEPVRVPRSRRRRRATRFWGLSRRDAMA